VGNKQWNLFLFVHNTTKWSIYLARHHRRQRMISARKTSEICNKIKHFMWQTKAEEVKKSL
jgi:hypothetical protein